MLFDNSEFLSNFNECCNAFVKMFFFVSCGNLYTDTCLILRDNRIVEAYYVNAFLKKPVCHLL